MRQQPPQLKGKHVAIILFLIVSFLVMLILVQENTLQHGEKVFLKTIPVDPRDVLRGDYVVLRYEIEEDSRVNTIIENNNLTFGDLIYLTLKKDANNLGSLKEVSLTQPNETELFIKAKIISTNTWRNNLELGIGKYFVPENRGRDIESSTQDLQVLVSIDKKGSAIIKDLYVNGTIIDFKDNAL